jgi:hypothetical protein
MLQLEQYIQGSGLNPTLLELIKSRASQIRAAQQNAKLVALSSRRAVPFYQALGYEESARYLRKFL